MSGYTSVWGYLSNGCGKKQTISGEFDPVGDTQDKQVFHNNSGDISGDGGMLYHYDKSGSLLLGSSHSIGSSAVSSYAFGTGNSINGEYQCAIGGNHSMHSNAAYGVCVGQSNTIDDEVNSIVIGTGSRSDAKEGIVIGHAYADIHDSQIVISATKSTETRPYVADGGENITLIGRNGGDYNRAVKIEAGEPTQSCEVKDHNGTLSWSYTPTDSGEWDTTPSNVGEALDEIATLVPFGIPDGRIVFAGADNALSHTGRFNFYKGNAASLECGFNLSFNGGDSSVIFGANGSINADYSFNTGYQNSISSDASFAMGANNSIDGNDSCATLGANNNITGGSTNNSIAIGAGNICSEKNTIAIGKDSTSSAENAIAIGYNTSTTTDESIGIGQVNITTHDGQIALSAVLETNTRPEISAGEETLTLHARNGANYDDAVIVSAGEHDSRRQASVKNHNGTLTWSYSPSTSGDWSSVPADVGSALDTLASDVDSISSTPTLSSGEYIPSVPWSHSPAPFDYLVGFYQRVGDIVNVNLAIRSGMISSHGAWGGFTTNTPIQPSSNFSDESRVVGTGTIITSVYTEPLTITADDSSKDISIGWSHSGSPGSLDLYASFSYTLN